MAVNANGLRGLTLAVRFLCEIWMLAALTYWGFHTQEGVLELIVGIGAPLAAAAIWGLFVAPKALRPVPVQLRLIVEFFLFGFTALALADADQPFLAVVFAVLAYGSSLLNAAQGSPREARPPSPG